MELADLRGHTARAIARQHKTAVERWLADALAAAHVSPPRDRAREIMLLMEGAMALMLIHGDRSYATAAARAARTLLREILEGIGLLANRAIDWKSEARA